MTEAFMQEFSDYPGKVPMVRLVTRDGRAEARAIAEQIGPHYPAMAQRLLGLVELASRAPLKRRLEYGHAWMEACPTPEEIAEAMEARRRKMAGRPPAHRVTNAVARLRDRMREYLMAHGPTTASSLSLELQTGISQIRHALLSADFEETNRLWNVTRVADFDDG